MLIDSMEALALEKPMADVARKYKVKQSTVLYHQKRFFASLRNAQKMLRFTVRAANQRQDEEVEGAWD